MFEKLEQPGLSKSALKTCYTTQTYHLCRTNLFMTFSSTCTGASVGQVRRDGDTSALIDTHALQTFFNSSDEPALPYQADRRCSSLVAVKETKRLTKEMSEVCVCSEDVNS